MESEKAKTNANKDGISQKGKFLKIDVFKYKRPRIRVDAFSILKLYVETSSFSETLVVRENQE